ncbi:hypothetical protein NE236_10130 [Actinoallomurus purpureus]|uniref:hypothetical protein n=1 Tax=Actinoallomurus purpureus TaxID=478114 RepID=UPI002092FABD|nr:hypothetical protein [Actinoallomurus purpureus]MCO6005342.1 hypothetical protein [Actinoallomurus purpureus]
MTPKYGPPFQPPKGGNGSSDPDSGKDFWGDVPDLAVPAPWGTTGPPSFNDDPSSPAGAGESPPGGIPLTTPISVNLSSLRFAMNSMLSDVKLLVSDYESLKSLVAAQKDTVFGQNATVTEVGNSLGNAAGQASGGGGSGSGNPQDHTYGSQIQPYAQDFAASINPAQEKTLEAIANSLELVGQFIAGVDRAGQTYSHADRLARFPEPRIWRLSDSGTPITPRTPTVPDNQV